MEIIYGIEDAIDKTKALAAVKREIKLYIEENKDRKIELLKLFLAAYQRVADKIWDSYKQGYNNHKKYDNMDIEYFHELFLQHLKEEKYYSINANKARKKALYDHLLYYLECNVPVLETTFEKKGKSCTKVQEWIKPYYKNIFIWSTTIILNNIEGYDFTGFGDVYVNIDTIKKTLKNTKLRGVLFSDNYKRNYVLIDPSIINIEGADFTGSKGAYIILDNIYKLPPRCNLTDTIILVKKVEDIKKFNLKKYGENVQIRQYSIIKDESIDVNFNEYLNYFGAINISEYKDLEDALRIETDDIEVIREKMNRTIAYDIAFNLVSSFAKIFDLKKALAYLIACCKTLMILEKNSPSLEMAEYLEYLEYTYNQYQRRIGDPALDRTKIIHNKEYYKIFTKNGVFTINTEKLINVLSNVICNHNDDSLQFLLNELNAINNHIEEMDRDKFIKLLTSSIANIIYQNLEMNNMGYSNTLKMTKNTKKK